INTSNPRNLPAIYIKETRKVSRSFIHEGPFAPKTQVPTGPAANLPEPLPPLYGYIRTSLKQSELATMHIEAPPEQDQHFPILAAWQYGLGKSVAFTSDARSKPGERFWDRDWADSDIYQKFWEQAVGWALRSVETGKMAMTTEYRDGVVKVTIDAR